MRGLSPYDGTHSQKNSPHATTSVLEAHQQFMQLKHDRRQKSRRAALLKLTDECMAAIKEAVRNNWRVRLIVTKEGVVINVGNGKGANLIFNCSTQTLPTPSDVIRSESTEAMRTVTTLNTKLVVNATEKTFAQTRVKAQNLVKEEHKKTAILLNESAGKKRGGTATTIAPRKRPMPTSSATTGSVAMRNGVPAPKRRSPDEGIQAAREAMAKRTSPLMPSNGSSANTVPPPPAVVKRPSPAETGVSATIGRDPLNGKRIAHSMAKPTTDVKAKVEASSDGPRHYPHREPMPTKRPSPANPPLPSKKPATAIISSSPSAEPALPPPPQLAAPEKPQLPPPVPTSKRISPPVAPIRRPASHSVSPPDSLIVPKSQQPKVADNKRHSESSHKRKHVDSSPHHNRSPLLNGNHQPSNGGDNHIPPLPPTTVLPSLSNHSSSRSSSKYSHLSSLANDREPQAPLAPIHSLPPTTTIPTTTASSFSVDSSQFVSNYERLYPEIKAQPTATSYVCQFELDYPAYRKAYALLVKVAAEFNALKAEFDAAPPFSHEQSEVLHRIQTRYNFYREDKAFAEARQRHAELHAKLTVMKRRVADWEAHMVSTSSNSSHHHHHHHNGMGSQESSPSNQSVASSTANSASSTTSLESGNVGGHNRDYQNYLDELMLS